ncbi:MAG: ATP-binding protein [Candidatus Absconditabacteria bacterium]
MLNLEKIDSNKNIRITNVIINKVKDVLKRLLLDNKSSIESNFEDLTLKISQAGLSIEKISNIFYESIKLYLSCNSGFILFKDQNNSLQVGFADNLGSKVISNNIIDFDISSSFCNSTNNNSIDITIQNYIVLNFNEGRFVFFNNLNGFSENDLIYLNRVSRLYKVTIQRIEYEIKLHEEQTKNNSLIENAHFGVLIIDGNGKVIHSNKIISDVLNISNSKLIGTSLIDLNNDFSNSFLLLSKLIISREGISSSLEFESNLDNGKIKYFKISGSYVNPQNHDSGIYIILEDISDSKFDQIYKDVLNKVLNILNYRNSSEISHLGDVSTILKNQLKVDGVFFRKVDDNGNLELLYNIGLSNKQVEVEKDFFNLEKFNCICHRIVKGQTGEHLSFSKYGSLYINNIRQFIKSTDLTGLLGFCHSMSGFESMIFVPLKSGNNVVGVMTLGSKYNDYFDSKIISLLESVGSSVGIDLAKCDAERNFFKSQMEMKLILDSLGKHLIVNYLDPGMKIVRSSSSSMDISNNDVESICGHKCISSSGKHITTCSNCSAKIAFETGVTSYGTITLNTGRVFYTISTPNIDEQGKVIGVIHMGLDITDIKEKEAELEKAMLLAEKADKDKSEFIYGITHELRTPLNGVLGGIELLTYKDSFDKGIDIIKNGGEQLLLLINDLLDFGKIESGHLSLIEIDFNLYDVISRLENTFFTMIKEKGIKFIVKGNSDIKLVGDPGRLSQILNNLVSNAIKFTYYGEVSVEVIVNSNSQGYIVDFIISDTGEGIPKGKMLILFDRFIQARNSNDPKYGGTGLGLSLVKSFVDMMNGKINVESKLGYGSKFTVSIPFKINNTLESESNSDSIERIKPLNVLLVEDEKINQYVASILLGKNNHTVLVADSFKSVDEIVNTNNFDIILLDYHLNDTNGEIIFNHLKGRGVNSKIIALTGSKHLDEHFIDLGFDGVLFKPFDMKAFKILISKLI